MWRVKNKEKMFFLNVTLVSRMAHIRLFFFFSFRTTSLVVNVFFTLKTKKKKKFQSTIVLFNP